MLKTLKATLWNEEIKCPRRIISEIPPPSKKSERVSPESLNWYRPENVHGYIFMQGSNTKIVHIPNKSICPVIMFYIFKRSKNTIAGRTVSRNFRNCN